MRDLETATGAGGHMADFFISLSGKDKAWGDWIAWQLKDAGFEVIYQHWHFQIGQNFLLHMEEAGRKAARTLVVLSDNYFASDFTLRELTQAVSRDPAGRKGTIIPVLVGACDLEGSLVGPLAHIDLTGAANEEIARHLLLDGLREKGPPISPPPFPGAYKDAREQKPMFPGEVVATLGSDSASALGALHDVPTLPPNYLPRPDELEPLRDALRHSDRRNVGITGVAQHLGLLGMGGIGKSVLAAAIARDRGVREAFPDDVIWLAIGREVEIRSRQADIVRILGGPPPTFETWQAGRAEIAKTTADRACLIILDDVWNQEHAEAFSRIGDRCRLLVTTRDGAVLEKIGATEHRIDILSPERARELLLGAAGADPETVPDGIDEVAKECGFLPLALAAVGALVRAGRFTWPEALDRLRRADLGRLRARLPEYEHDGLLAALEVSVHALPETAGKAFLACAAFPEDIAIPEAALQKLWWEQCPNPDDASDIAQLLVERSLLRRDDAHLYRLHDLYHDYVRASAASLPALHGKLVEAYRARCADGWHGGPDDGYFFQHLPWHLREAGHAEELQRLLFDYRWLRAKLEAVGLAGVIQDFEQLGTGEQAQKMATGLRLFAHVVAGDPEQLASQLLGRFAADDGAEIAALLTNARKHADRPSLLPLRRSLTPPGGGPRRWGHCGGGDAGGAARGLGLGRPDVSTMGPRDGQAAHDLHRRRGLRLLCRDAGRADCGRRRRLRSDPPARDPALRRGLASRQRRRPASIR
jgi:NB-ARC domain/TIR domain/APAF-1 helical domain